MRKTGFGGLLLICILAVAKPVNVFAAEEDPTAPAIETMITSEAETASDDGESNDSSITIVTETTEDSESVKESSSDPAEEPADNPALKDETSGEESADLKEDPDKEDVSDPTQDAAPEDTSDTAETPAVEESAEPDEVPAENGTAAAESEDNALSADPASDPDEQLSGENSDENVAAIADEASITAELSLKSDSASEAEEETADRIHFIALNGERFCSDAILVESNGLYGLIDSSNPSGLHSDLYNFKDSGGNGMTVVEYLTDINVHHLTFVLATHSHTDHLGGMPDVAASGLVNNNTVYIYKDYEVTTESSWHNDYYSTLAVNAMRAKGASLLNLLNPNQKAIDLLGAEWVEDSEDSLADHLVFTMGDFLIKLFNLHTTSYTNENLNSVVTTIQKGETRSVLMGDMEMTDYIESRTLAAINRVDETSRTDLYKLGHHGYHTSTSPETIKTMNPENCVVTTNSVNPKQGTYTFFNYFIRELGGNIYRTSENSSGIVAEIGTDHVTMMKITKGTDLTTAVPWNAIINDGWYRWYPDDDCYNRTGYKWIYIKSGSAVKGWFEVNNEKYFANDNYVLQTGWVKSDGNWYYLNSSGVMQTSWQLVDGKWYLLDNDGVMQTGWKMVGYKQYYFDESGAMQTGWLKSDDKWYYFNSNGELHVGWKMVNGKWYLFDSNGVMQTDWKMVGYKQYYFDESGAMQTGWLKSDDKWYFLDDSGEMHIGWKIVNGKWYLLDSSGVMQTGWQTLSYKNYYFDESGAMQTGWKQIDGKWYLLDTNGVRQTGWKLSNGLWYLFDDAGVMQTGLQLVDGKYYLLSSSGAMQTGWAYSDGNWYYLNKYGELQTGWQLIGSKWYLLSDSGVMQTGWQTVGSDSYYFNDKGVMQTGWVTSDGKWYYLENSGAMAKNKWVGVYYLKSNGEMAVSEWIDTYYVGPDGKWIEGYSETA